MKLIIRDGHAVINGDKTTFEMPSGSLDVVTSDGRALCCITPMANGRGVQISFTSHVKTDDHFILSETLLVHPVASNVIEVFRAESDF